MTVSLRCGCAFFLEKSAIIKCCLSLPESVARQGYLQVTAGMVLVKEKGMDIEDVKSALWDIYDGAMASLMDSLRKGNGDGEKEKDDGQGEKG